MITAEISCDIASLAIEAGDTIFTLANDIGADGGFNVYIYLDPKDIETAEDAELMHSIMDARSGAFLQRLIVGPRQARICWSDCYDPYQTKMNKVIYKGSRAQPLCCNTTTGQMGCVSMGRRLAFCPEGGFKITTGAAPGEIPGAAPIFFHTHIRAKAQGADRLAGHLDRGRRDPEKLTNIPLNVNQLAGAQTCGARTLTRGRRN